MAGRTAAGKEGAGRQSIAMKPGRPSVAPGALLDRRSSAFGKAGAGLKADPRPLGDKNFLNACIRTVITYLSTHGYPYAVSPKVLTSPTGKDFAQIVQFLFQRFDPSMKVFGKVEDEVPLFFKRLNYPFQISKSALFAVGSPHSWPSVLAALTWLVELLNYEEKAEDAAADPAGPGSLDSDRQRSERAFYDYVSGSYRRGGGTGGEAGRRAAGAGPGARERQQLCLQQPARLLQPAAARTFCRPSTWLRAQSDAPALNAARAPARAGRSSRATMRAARRRTRRCWGRSGTGRARCRGSSSGCTRCTAGRAGAAGPGVGCSCSPPRGGRACGILQAACCHPGLIRKRRRGGGR